MITSNKPDRDNNGDKIVIAVNVRLIPRPVRKEYIRGFFEYISDEDRP